MEQKTIVIIESPYAGDIEENLAYVRACMSDCFDRGEVPFASHALYTQPGVLDDTKPEERKLGIEAGYAFWDCASLICFYNDFGWSPGMDNAFMRAILLEKDIQIRSIYANTKDVKLDSPK